MILCPPNILGKLLGRQPFMKFFMGSGSFQLMALLCPWALESPPGASACTLCGLQMAKDREREEAGQGVARGDFYEPDGGVAYISLPTCPWPGPSLWAQLTARETGKCGLPVSKQNMKLVLVNSWPSQLYLLSYFIESMTSSVQFSSVKSLSHVRLFATP